MKSRYLWAVLGLTSMSTSGCFSAAEWGASLACPANRMSADCRYYSDAAEREKEGEEYSVWLDRQFDGENQCRASGGSWVAGAFGAEAGPVDGWCSTQSLYAARPRGVSDYFALDLSKATRRFGPAGSLDERASGALCRIGAEGDLTQALAVMGREYNMGDEPPDVLVDHPSGARSVYDVQPEAGDAWGLILREHRRAGEGDLIFERLERLDGGRGSFLVNLTLEGGEVLEYQNCAKSSYTRYLPNG